MTAVEDTKSWQEKTKIDTKKIETRESVWNTETHTHFSGRYLCRGRQIFFGEKRTLKLAMILSQRQTSTMVLVCRCDRIIASFKVRFSPKNICLPLHKYRPEKCVCVSVFQTLSRVSIFFRVNFFITNLAMRKAKRTIMAFQKPMLRTKLNNFKIRFLGKILQFVKKRWFFSGVDSEQSYFFATEWSAWSCGFKIRCHKDLSARRCSFCFRFLPWMRYFWSWNYDKARDEGLA